MSVLQKKLDAQIKWCSNFVKSLITLTWRLLILAILVKSVISVVW